MSRSKRKTQAEETLAIIERGGYEVGGFTVDISHHRPASNRSLIGSSGST